MSSVVDYIGKSLHYPESGQYTLVVKDASSSYDCNFLTPFVDQKSLLPTSHSNWLDRKRLFDEQMGAHKDFIWARQTFWLKSPPPVLYLDYLTVSHSLKPRLNLSASKMYSLGSTEQANIKRISSPVCNYSQSMVLRIWLKLGRKSTFSLYRQL